MSARLRRIVFWAVPTSVLVLMAIFALRPTPVEADLVSVVRGPLVVTVVEEGEARIRDVFVLSAPIRGRSARIEAEAGDYVVAGRDVLAEIEPADPEFLDRRTEAEATAAVDRAKANLALAEAEVKRLKAEAAYTASELGRARSLGKSRTISERAVDDAVRAQRMAAAAVDAAVANVRARQSELAAAEAHLLRPSEQTDGRDCACLSIHAPISGLVLRVFQESAGVVEAGRPLLEIGDPEDIEIVAEFLSTEAVQIEKGQRVVIEDWGGDAPLRGTVDRVEPYAFTKVSALGIEEQRANVVIAMSDPPEAWSRLGHGYQVEARVVIWEATDALKAPLTALFRSNGRWAAFVVDEDGALAERPIRIGRMTDIETEVLEGLNEGDDIVRYPNDAMGPGTKVVARGAG